MPLKWYELAAVNKRAVSCQRGRARNSASVYRQELFSMLKLQYNLDVGTIERDSGNRTLYGFLYWTFCEHGHVPYETQLRLELVTESCCEFESVDVSGIELLQVPMTDVLSDRVLCSSH